MVSAKSNRGLIKALYNSTRASKGNKPILWFTFAIRDSICSFQVRFLQMTKPKYLIESSLSRFSDQWQAWYLDGLQPPITTKQYELPIRCGHLTTIPNRWISAYLKWPVRKWIRLGKWIRPRRRWTSLPRCEILCGAFKAACSSFVAWLQHIKYSLRDHWTGFTTIGSEYVAHERSTLRLETDLVWVKLKVVCSFRTVLSW